MKKYLILLGLLGKVSSAVGNEKIGQFGLEVAPGISFNRIYYSKDPNNFHLVNKGLLTFSIGGKYNFYLQEYVDFSMGLFFLGKGVTIQGSTKEKKKIYESHALKYLQIPLLFNFYTNEICLDTKIYFKLGIAITGLLHNRSSIKELEQEAIFMKHRPIILQGIIGGGIKYDLSPTTAFLIGLSYQYDIFGTFKQQYSKTETIWCHNDFLGLDLGFVF